MTKLSKMQMINELESAVLEKFRGLSARELSIKQLENLLEIRKTLLKIKDDTNYADL